MSRPDGDGAGGGRGGGGGGEAGFLSRWSRLKQDGPEDEAAVSDAHADGAPTSSAAPEPATEDERSDEEILAALGLKHPDSLQPGDDVRGFMQAAVPDRLRRLALRSLWRSNPTLANLDGLVEYGEDYTDAATVPDILQTVYRVGKGMLPDPEPEPGLEADDAGDVGAEDAGAEDAVADASDPAAPTAAPAEPERHGEGEGEDEPAETSRIEPQPSHSQDPEVLDAAADFVLREGPPPASPPLRRRMVFR